MTYTLWAAVVAVVVLVGCGPTGAPDGGTGGGGGSVGGGAGGGGGGLPDAGPGCRANDNCTSGACTPAGDCVNCQADLECDEGNACGTVTCQRACSTSAPCPTTGGWACVSGRCVNPQRDPAHCGSSGAACAPGTFCAGGACVPATFASVCALPLATILLDGQPADDQAGQALGAALVAACAPSLSARTAGQADAGVLSVRDGKPLALGELLVVAGGSFRQQAIRWFEQSNAAPVRDSSTATQMIYSRQDGGVVSSVPLSDLSATRDRLLVQLARAPHGPVVLMAFGNYAEGTRAAASYFVTALLPTYATSTTSWVVLDWSDANTNGQGDPGEYTVVGSGP